MPPPAQNADIARVFDAIADMLEIQAANPFRVRAYRNAARVVGTAGVDFANVVRAGAELPKIAGIGDDLAAKIREIVATGTCKMYEELRGQLPSGLTELLELPGLGPKRVMALHRDLKIRTRADLERAAREERIRGLPGFGPKTEARILEALRVAPGATKRFKLTIAASEAEALAERLRAVPGVVRVEIAGSYRRMRETVGDIDLLAIARRPAAVMAAFTGDAQVQTTLARGSTRSSVVLRSGLQVDLRVVPAESYGAAMHYFTGSKAHNIAIRRLAQARGLKLNEYGVFRGARRVAGATEASVFGAVGLPEIAPELREDSGEIEAARARRLPQLVPVDDLRGDLHCSAREPTSIQALAAAAARRGLAYIAITDRLDAAALARRLDEIARCGVRGLRILSGVEASIGEDGTLDIPDRLLERVDVVAGCVHRNFDLSRERQTERVLRALDSSHLRILVQPFTRAIPPREIYDVDMLAIVRKAKARGVHLALIADPDRMDLLDSQCRMAKDAGVLVSVSAGAQSPAELDRLRFAVGQARRGWLAKSDVLNTRTLGELAKLLARAGK